MHHTKVVVSLPRSQLIANLPEETQSLFEVFSRAEYVAGPRLYAAKTTLKLSETLLQSPTFQDWEGLIALAKRFMAVDSFHSRTALYNKPSETAEGGTPSDGLR